MERTKIILVRHGACGKSGTYCGHSDAPLTDAGRRQIHDIATSLARSSIPICYCSPLIRAQQSARIICSARSIPIVVSPLLKEIDFGQWEGLTYDEVSKRWPKLAQQWLTDPTQVAVPSGETFPSFLGRVKQFFSQLRHANASGDLLIVAHGGPIAAILLENYRNPVSEFFSLIPPLGSARTIELNAREPLQEVAP